MTQPNKHHILHWSLFILSILFIQCGTSVYYVKPPDWENRIKRDSVIANFEHVLKGRTIFIDPGHGGDDRKSIGPAKDVVEADVNLRVALTLRSYLKQAGANVIMSRETDQSIPLDVRAQQANAHNADLFISIHHNSTGNLFTNYTSTWYHSQPGKKEYQPSSHDLARYIQRDLAFVMGNPGSLASFDGTISDYLLYPEKGLAVLRETKMPAVLIECSFFSSAYEEQRLKLPDFNNIEAWGIFRGIGKYLEAGTPVISYQSPLVFSSNRPSLEISVHDSSGIDDEFNRVYIDGKEEGFSFNAKKGIIKITPAEELAAGYHQLTARVRNKNNNHSFPFAVDFSIGTPPSVLKSQIQPPELPLDPRAFSFVIISATDSLNNNLHDGLPIHFLTNTGVDTIVYTRYGSAIITLPATRDGYIQFTASNGPVNTSGTIAVKPSVLYTRGIIMTSDGKPAAGATITFPDGKNITASHSGDYIIGGKPYFGVETYVSKKGYFSRREAFSNELVQDPVVLTPVARGILFRKTFLVDVIAAHGNSSLLNDKSRVDVQLANRLHSLLDGSAAECILIDEIASSPSERRKLFLRYPNATIIHIGLDERKSILSSYSSDLDASRQLTKYVMRSLPTFTGLLMQSNIPRYPSRDETAKMRQMSLFVPAPGIRSYDARLIPLVASNLAWGIYHGVLISEGYATQGTKKVEVTVVKKNTKEPAGLVEVVLNNSLHAVTDSRGICKFFAVTVPEDDVKLLDTEQYEISGVKTETLN